MTERDELIKELRTKWKLEPMDAQDVSLIILDDRRTQIAKVVEPLKKIGARTGYKNKQENPKTGNEHYWDDVREALSIANKIMQDAK